MRTLQGIPASRGIAFGPSFQYQRAQLEIVRCRADHAPTEWGRLESALVVARDQLKDIYQHALSESGAAQAAIFEAQSMMLDDPELLEGVRTIILQQGINAEAAFADSAEGYACMLESLEDEYLRARAADIRDVANRVLRILMGLFESPDAGLKEPSIILAEDLTPSDTVLLDKSMVLGFCTVTGGATSHTAILARGLGLPAVVGAGSGLLTIPDRTLLIVDGEEGRLVIDPEVDTEAIYRQRQSASELLRTEARRHSHEPAITLDGHHVEVVANIGGIEDAESALQQGAEGVGLLRTEFLYLESDHLPDEEEQYSAYRAITDQFGALPVVLRTMDIGGDKELPYLQTPPESNPFLGLRAIRLCLAHPQLFKPQLRAALRAGVGSNLMLMFPMVATIAEIRAARALLDTCRDELISEGKPVPENMQIGIMVEIPSTAVMADQFAREVDFFSIGTNDLSQYTMAADRTNAAVAEIASAFHPAVLRLIKQVIDAAHANGKWVGLCGELAGEPLAIPILLGMGLDEFSMNPPAIPIAKQIIRTTRMDDARGFANEVLNLTSAEEVEAYSKRMSTTDSGSKIRSVTNA
jgi:phosphotransferase system enzyme I (PtsI)